MTTKVGGHGKLVLILGGVRSGKSRFAQELATELGGDDVLFVATAEAGDEEMSRRIRIHRESRSASWQTLEQPLSVGSALAAVGDELPAVVIIDCLTLLITNIMMQVNCDTVNAEKQILAEIESLLQLTHNPKNCLIIVSGEVGMGIVPETPLGRTFRDLLGWSNQALAAKADATYIMICGHAINATRLASSAPQVADELNQTTAKAIVT